MMVSIKEATEKAIEFARAALEPERTMGIRLEEVESTKVDGQEGWLIALSMMSADDPLAPFVSALGRGKREYKTFTVLKDTGEVQSMKIRELANI